MKILCLTIVLMSFNIYANEKGNGGDICENRIMSIANDIESWILKGGSMKLDLGSISVSQQEYNRKMLIEIKRTKVSCPSDRVFIGRSEKTCKNFIDESGIRRIQCNFDRFINKTNEEEQYRLVHHEYAGLAGFEINDRKGVDYENSDYFISNQLTAFLENVTTKKLALVPTGRWFDGSKNYESIHINEDGTVSVVQPRFKDPTGTNSNLLLSNDSYFNGVCKLYGLGPYVSDSMIDFNTKSYARKVVLSHNGTFLRFTETKDDWAIKSITCEGEVANTISDNYKTLTLNDDGTKTVFQPKFMINGNNLRLSNDSYFNGVCKLYGLGPYVSDSMIDFNTKSYARKVVLSHNGTFLRFTETKDDWAIKSLVCE